jgi:hypothetical protein
MGDGFARYCAGGAKEVKPREIAHAIEAKVPGDTGDGKERNRWAIIDGKRVLRVTYPNSHSADIKRGTLESIRKQLRLDREPFLDFVNCPMSRSQYMEHLRSLLSSDKI